MPVLTCKRTPLTLALMLAFGSPLAVHAQSAQSRLQAKDPDSVPTVVVSASALGVVSDDMITPVSSLGGEYFIHDDRTHSLVGERTGKRWPLGMAVEVRLTEATPITGGLLFEMLSEPMPADASMPRPRLGVRGRGGPPQRRGGKGQRRR